VTYLLDKTSWEGMRTDYCTAVRRPVAGQDRLTQINGQLEAELASFAGMLAAGRARSAWRVIVWWSAGTPVRTCRPR
jgi:hypothetical protein